jgi:hypothetical protein
MFPVHRDVLSKFVHHEALKDVSTYHGYRGDYLLKMTTRSDGLVNLITSYCEMKNIEYVIGKPNIVEGYEIFIIAVDDEVIPIKMSKNPSGDRWYEKKQ